MRRIFLLLFFGVWMDVGLTAQHEASIASNHFFAPSVALGWFSFRDFGSSPLFYNGPGLQLSMGDRWERTKGCFWFNTTVNAALTAAQTPRSEYLQAQGNAIFLGFRIDGGYLRRVNVWSEARRDVWVGGALVSDLIVRQNGQLGNAQVGTDVLANLMAAAKITYDLSRQSADTLNLKLIRLRRNPKNQSLDFQMNVGVLNLNYRPGYAYVHDSELTGEPGLSYVLADHRWTLNGWRLATSLGYVRRQGNGNATRLAYCWEALHAPGRFHAFQFAAHRLKVVFMFNTTKRKP